MKHNMKDEALIIVHLSSIENYLSFFGADAALELAACIKIGIITHPGPVLIMDQDDETSLSQAGKELRSFILDARHYHPESFTLLHHDELQDAAPWEEGMQPIIHQLREWGVKRVRLGGFWASRSGQSGCVHETYRQLCYRGFSCMIVPRLCGYE
jgi:hypothetical protein